MQNKKHTTPKQKHILVQQMQLLQTPKGETHTMTDETINVKDVIRAQNKKQDFLNELTQEAKKRKQPACYTCASLDWAQGKLKQPEEYFKLKTKGAVKKIDPASKYKNQKPAVFIKAECNYGHTSILELTPEEYETKTKP